MFSTTTNAVEGRPVREYLGIVTGEVIVGANLFRDLFASITDIVGGRSGKYEDVLARARKEAIAEMEAEEKRRVTDRCRRKRNDRRDGADAGRKRLRGNRLHLVQKSR